MKISIKKKIGNSVLDFTVDAPKPKEALFDAGFLAEMPDTCGLCQSKEVSLSSNKAKGYTFIKVKCSKCNARADMGEYKDGGYFWKQWEKYEAPVKSAQAPQNIPPQTIDDKELDLSDIPL